MSKPVIQEREAFKDASVLARKIGSKCLLDDGWFDTTKCAAYIEPILIERDTKLLAAEDVNAQMLEALKTALLALDEGLDYQGEILDVMNLVREAIVEAERRL